MVVSEISFVGCGSNTANLGDWWEYDINSDSWSQKPDIPGNDRHHPYYFGIGNYAYVGFGHEALQVLEVIHQLVPIFTMIFIDMIQAMIHGYN